MLRIRLSRVGKRKQPAYRIVVADSRSPRDGAFLKIIGHYNPLTDPATLVVKEDEAVHWLEKGARPSETAAKLLTRIGVMERAGRQPVRWAGKDVPPAPKKAAKDEGATATAPEAPAAAGAEAAQAAAESEAAAEEPEAQSSAEAAIPADDAADDESEANSALPEEPPEAAPEAEPQETEPVTESEATDEEAPQA